MIFNNRNLRAIAEAIIGDAEHFPYRSSSFITQFFEECDLDFVLDGRGQQRGLKSYFKNRNQLHMRFQIGLCMYFVS